MADTQSVDDPVDGDERPMVSAHSCSEDRTVFTEKGNADAWISTDTTLELHR